MKKSMPMKPAGQTPMMKPAQMEKMMKQHMASEKDHSKAKGKGHK